MKKYDIFISYRRDGGEQSAKNIFDRLKDKGYNVFLDVETLRSGAFNQKLYSVIEECEDVVVVLSPGALERCDSENDWVRLEISHALSCKKNIVPVMLRDFAFPEKLPVDIEDLRYQNGVQASVEFFDAFVEKLCSFLKSKSGIVQRFNHSASWRKALIAVICCILIGIGIWGTSVVIHQKAQETGSYPITQKQKNDVNSLIYTVQMNLSIMDNMFYSMDNSIKACEDYLNSGSSDGYTNLIAQFNHTTDTLVQQSDQAVKVSPELKTALADTKINMADLESLSKYPGTLLLSYKNTLNYLKFVADRKQPLDDVTRKRVLEINKELIQLDAENIFLGTCQLLLPVKEDTLKDFRTEFLPSLYVVSNSLKLWSKDEVGLKSQQDSIATQQNKLMNEFAKLVGNLNIQMLSEKEALAEAPVKQSVAEKAYEPESTSVSPVNNSYSATDSSQDTQKKQNELQKKQEELQKKQEELEAAKKELREKFSPKASDDPGIVWGKALRFLTVAMYDDTINAMQFYLNQVKDTDENAVVYVPAAIKFVRQIGNTGIDYGLIVAGYEPDKPHHAVYLLGDIIIAVNKTPCKNITEFQKIRSTIPQDHDYTVTVLRPDTKGNLQPQEVTIPSGQPKVALMSLHENE